jgi:hypothetical protein
MSSTEELPHRAVVFEDNERAFGRLEATLREHANRVECSVRCHQGGEGGDVSASIIEPKPASLVVLDWDLSGYDPPVHRELVRGICTEKYVPLCTYHLDLGEHEKLKRLLRWNDDEIAVDSLQDHAEIGRRCGEILEGFVAIQDSFARHLHEDLGRRVRRILSAPDNINIQLEQYSWGQQRLVQVIEAKERERFVSTAIGYWIFNQLLQFPGLLVNTVAAASYLDIDADAFQSRDEVRGPFARALYHGPFSKLGPFFWLPILDDIRAENMGEDDEELISGRDVLKRKGVNVDRVRCSQGHEGAGYYCLVTERPVCGEHSVAPSGWVPIGADRSRIEKEKYRELSAWLKI